MQIFIPPSVYLKYATVHFYESENSQPLFWLAHWPLKAQTPEWTLKNYVEFLNLKHKYIFIIRTSNKNKWNIRPSFTVKREREIYVDKSLICFINSLKLNDISSSSSSSSMERLQILAALKQELGNRETTGLINFLLID